jgi:hypothetical protein
MTMYHTAHSFVADSTLCCRQLQCLILVQMLADINSGGSESCIITLKTPSTKSGIAAIIGCKLRASELLTAVCVKETNHDEPCPTFSVNLA